MSDCRRAVAWRALPWLPSLAGMVYSWSFVEAIPPYLIIGAF